VLGCISGVTAGGLIFAKKAVSKKIERIPDSYDKKAAILIRKALTLSSIGMAILSLMLLVLSTLVIVPAGHIGVPTLFGKVINTTLSEGISIVNPLWYINKMTIRTETYTMVSAATEGSKTGDDSIYTQSSDGVVMNMDVTVVYRLLSADAPMVFRYFGRNYVDAIVRPAAKSALPEITSKYSFQDAYTVKRDELGFKVGEKMNAVIESLISQQLGSKSKGILVQQVLIRKIEPPTKIKESIELKMAAEQESERMKYVLLKEKQEADRKKIEATGIQTFQDIVSKGISPQLLQWKGIEATEMLAKSNNTKVVIIGSGKGGLPVILNMEETKTETKK
jgi:regulator of protease activity HflC (stomatin/prohibitin superfamily)